MFPKSSATELVGTVRAILWSNWSECAADPTGGFQGVVIARLSDNTVVKGPSPEDEIEIGSTYRFLGRKQTHAQYGDQFAFSTFCLAEPATRQGTIRYLVKLAPNVGEVTACKLWDTFGPEAVATLRTNPQAVADANILTLDQATKAAAVLAKESGLEQTKIDLFGLFDRRGFPGNLIEACISRWGARAGQRIRKNPFGMLVGRPRLPGCGFKRIDKLYLDLGGKSTALKRQMLAGWNALREDSSGNTWLPQGVFRQAITRAVGDDEARHADALELGIRSKWLATYKDEEGQVWVAEAGKAKNERRIAEKVKELRAAVGAAPKWLNAYSEIVPGVLSPHQLDRLKVSLSSSIGILAGTPGTGKTFTAAQVVKYLACRFGLDSIAVCAPTGKAAVRCTSAMLSYAIDLEAITIHRLLKTGRNGHDGGGWQFEVNESNPLGKRFVIIDEASMCDADITAALLSACAPGTHLLFVGDPYQLPPVGHGAPLRDMIAAGIPCGELTEIRRNSGMIVEACRDIKNGRPFATTETIDVPNGKNLKCLSGDTPEDQIAALTAVLNKIAASGKFSPVWDCQVLATVNDKSKISRRALNSALQPLLNPAGESIPPNPFRIGDKIICTRNSGMPLMALMAGKPGNTVDSYMPLVGRNEFVANGEIGNVMAVGPKLTIARFDPPNRLIKIVMGKPKESDGEGEEADSSTAGTVCDFELAYAITTHKSQGSEWPVVIVMIDDSPGARRVCSREHIYTAVSRGKTLTVLIGKMPALEMMAQKVSLDKRKTFLKELLGALDAANDTADNPAGNSDRPKEFDGEPPQPGKKEAVQAGPVRSEAERGNPENGDSEQDGGDHSGEGGANGVETGAELHLCDIPDMPPYVRHCLKKAGMFTVEQLQSEAAKLKRSAELLGSSPLSLAIYGLAHVSRDAADAAARAIERAAVAPTDEELQTAGVSEVEVPDGF
ncbi:MAG: AAA family ATPase [Patescibacteria group bacterium]|nr:AAA family ATPase [Patescibacteria group bacterium]